MASRTTQKAVTNQPTASGKSNGGKASTVTPPIEKTSSKQRDTKENVSGACELSVEEKQALFNSLSKKLKDKIKSSVKGQEEENIEKMAATFIIKSVKENKPVDVKKEDFDKIVEVAGQEILGKDSKDIKEKVFKFKDGNQTTISELLDKRTRTGSGTDRKQNNTPTMPTDGNQVSENDKKSEQELSRLEKKFEARGVELSEKENEIKQKDLKLKEKEEEIEKKVKEIENKDKEIDNMKQALEQRDLQLKEKAEELEVNRKEIEDCCKRYDEQANVYKQEISKLKLILGQKEATLDEKQVTLGNMEQQLEEAYSKITALDNEVKAQHMQYIEARRALEKANRTVDQMKESHEDAIRHKDNQFKELLADRDDLRHRFSKLAGAKLTDQNPDIADLSDPNRAMKLSEKFGTLYDDQWTDAYEHLRKKKMSIKDAIALLLDVLKKCEEFCNRLKETQMDSLNNVLLHPKQDVESFGSEPRKHVGGFKEHSRIKSDDKKAVRELRRQIGVGEGVLEEIKQVFVQETKSWPDKKNLEGCTPYLHKCAEICWLMVLHDPPLYMKMDAQRGDPFDSSLYSVYSASGDKIDFLVWPPLFNNQGGGLLSKGTAEPMKVVKKT